MNRLLTSIICLILLHATRAQAQAIRPTIMVVPSDVWCSQHGYMLSFENEGKTVRVPDYKRAFQENELLLLAVSKINGLLAERGYNATDMESAMKTAEMERVTNNILTSKTGAGVAQNPMDEIKLAAKADLILQLTWSVNNSGPKQSISYILRALDAYTDEQVFATAEVTPPSSFAADIPTLLAEAVLLHMDAFNDKLREHMDEILIKGRGIVIRIKRFDSWGGDLEQEYEGKELNEIIKDWMRANCMNKNFNVSDQSENLMVFRDVRIPLFGKDKNPIDARTFTNGLRQLLKHAPYNIQSKLTMKGLGEATLVLGEK